MSLPTKQQNTGQTGCAGLPVSIGEDERREVEGPHSLVNPYSK